MSIESDKEPLPVMPKTDTKVMLVCPWQKTVHPLTAYSTSMLAQRHRMQSMLHFGDAFIAHARNKCADAFLKSKADYMLMVDDDMVVPFGHQTWFKDYGAITGLTELQYGADVVRDLLATGKTLVGGRYYQRNEKGKPVFSSFSSNKEEPVRQVRWVGTGALMIHRQVLLDIESTFPGLSRVGNNGSGQWFSSSEHELTHGLLDLLTEFTGGAVPVSRLQELVDRTRVNSTVGMGEDVQFCIRAAQAGHWAHVAMDVVCGHIGSTVFGPHNTSGKR
jgi:hypothetical protein